MTLAKKIGYNTLIHTIGKFIGSALGLVIIGLLTRYLGTAGYGFYTTIFAYLFFFSTIGDLGLYLVTINELGRTSVDQKTFFSNIFTIRFSSGIVLMLLAGVLIWFFPYPYLVKIGTLIISLSVFLMMVDQIVVALFQAKMKTKYVALAEIIGKMIVLGLTILVIQMDLGFLPVLWTVVAGLVVHFLINIFYARKILPFKFAFNPEIWQKIFKKSWPVATYMVFSMIYFKADTIILSLYHPQSVVGLYGAPYKMLEVLIVFPAIFMGLVSPHLSSAFSKNNLINFKKYFQTAFDFLSIVIWPLILGTIVLAEPLMNFIAGKNFLLSAPILQILIVATGIIFIAHLSTFAVVACGKQKEMMKFYILAALMALFLYFTLIPNYSYYAAALITVSIELFILIASWLMVKKTTKIKISFKNNLKSLLGSLVMAAVLYLTDLSLIISVVGGAIIYIILIYFLGIFKKDILKDFLIKKGR